MQQNISSHGLNYGKKICYVIIFFIHACLYVIFPKSKFCLFLFYNSYSSFIFFLPMIIKSRSSATTFNHPPPANVNLKFLNINFTHKQTQSTSLYSAKKKQNNCIVYSKLKLFRSKRRKIQIIQALKDYNSTQKKTNVQLRIIPLEVDHCRPPTAKFDRKLRLSQFVAHSDDFGIHKGKDISQYNDKSYKKMAMSTLGSLNNTVDIKLSDQTNKPKRKSSSILIERDQNDILKMKQNWTPSPWDIQFIEDNELMKMIGS